MAIPAATLHEEAGQLIWQYAGDESGLDILLFLARHPHARFTRLAILHALGGSRLVTEQALGRLTDSGGLRRQVENGVALYSLGGNAQLRSALLGTVSLDHCQRWRVLKGIPHAAGV